MKLVVIMERALRLGANAIVGIDLDYETIGQNGSMQMPFQMCNMPLIGSQYWNIAYGREEGQSAQDIEGMQTMRTLANNMAWTLKKMHGIETTEAPEREPWTPMHFIR